MNSFNFDVKLFYLFIVKMSNISNIHPYDILLLMDNNLLPKETREEIIKELKRNSDNIRWAV